MHGASADGAGVHADEKEQQAAVPDDESARLRLTLSHAQGEKASDMEVPTPHRARIMHV